MVRLTLRWLMPATVGLAIILLGQMAMATSYHLRLDGDRGTEYTGSCLVLTNDSETEVTLQGTVPHEQDIVGDGLACRLEATGRLVVDIVHDGSRSRSTTSGGTVNIKLR